MPKPADDDRKGNSAIEPIGPALFADTLRELVTDVFGPLGLEHGVAAEDVEAGERRLGVRFPRVLRDYFHLVGRHDGVSEGMNHLLRPDAVYLSNGGLVFEEENQQYYFSAIPIDQLERDDPPVQQGNHGEASWYPESNRLSDYLLATICWQATNYLPAATEARVNANHLARMKAELRWASFGLDEADDTVGLWGDGVAAVAFTKSMELFLSSGSDKRLDGFKRRFGL